MPFIYFPSNRTPSLISRIIFHNFYFFRQTEPRHLFPKFIFTVIFFPANRTPSLIIYPLFLPEQGPDGTINASNWLNNILPAPKGGEQQQQQPGQPISSGGGDASVEELTPPSQQQMPPSMSSGSGVGTPMKPVNLLPEVPNSHQSRKLSEKESRDCEVIGKCNFCS